MRDRFLAALVAAALCVLPSIAGAQLVTRTMPGEPDRGSASPTGPYTTTPYGAAAQGGGAPYAPAMPMEASGGTIDSNRRIQQGDQLMVRIDQDRDGNIPVAVSQSGEVLV